MNSTQKRKPEMYVLQELLMNGLTGIKINGYIPAAPSPSSAAGSAPRPPGPGTYSGPAESPVESSSLAPSDFDSPGPRDLFSAVENSAETN